MKITTRARDENSDQVSIWQQAPIKTYGFFSSKLTPEERHKEAAIRWHIIQTGQVPKKLESKKEGPYKRETWTHVATAALVLLALTGCGIPRAECYQTARDSFMETTDECMTDECIDAASEVETHELAACK